MLREKVDKIFLQIREKISIRILFIYDGPCNKIRYRDIRKDPVFDVRSEDISPP